MTLVSITLDEDEQEYLLGHAERLSMIGEELRELLTEDEIREIETARTPHREIMQPLAEKIRRAQDTSPFEVHPREKHCAECGRPDDDDHDDAVDFDHRWR